MTSFIESLFQSAKKKAEEDQERDDELYRVRWVLGDETPEEPHCDACLKYAGKYTSYQAMLEATGGCVPGYFEGWETTVDEEFELSPGKVRGVACGALCRCHLELFRDGAWGRI